MYTTEVSLVDFFKLGLGVARKAGYDAVLCLIAREADAPNAYDEIIKYWESIDDLTGSGLMFVFAGHRARYHHKSSNIFHGCDGIPFTADALLLPAPKKAAIANRDGTLFHEHVDMETLKANTQEGISLRQSKSPIAKRQVSAPVGRDIAISQTSQITELRNHLALREADIPCFHLTFLERESSVHFPIKPHTNGYTTIKAIVEALEPREVDVLKAELLLVEQRCAELGGQLVRLRTKQLFAPQEPLLSAVSALEGAVPNDVDQQRAISDLTKALRAHAERPDDASRRAALDRFRATRDVLRRQPNWSAIKAGVQRTIDIASKYGPINTPENAASIGATLEAKRLASISEIHKDLTDQQRSKRALEQKVQAMLAPEALRMRVERASMPQTEPIMEAFVVVAAGQELEAVRNYLDSRRAHRQPTRLSRSVPAEHVSIDDGTSLKFTLIVAAGQGLEDMTEVLNAIQGHSAKTVILVGMMAGIPGKSALLDVQAPRNIINATRIGNRDGHLVPEPQGREVDRTLHHRLTAIDRTRHGIADIRLITHKHSACVAAKFDDLSSELARAALAFDPENVVGLEMEGSAITMRQAAPTDGARTSYIMIKGVADYAGSNPTGDEIGTLRTALASIEGLDVDQLLAVPDPTRNKPLKSALQKMATIRALRVALALLAD